MNIRAYVCVGLVYVHIYTHAKVKGYCQLSYSLTIHLRFLRQGLSLYLQPLVLTRIIGQDLSVSIPSTRFIDIKSNNQILCRHWGFELSSSCFQCKSSYYLSHTLSTFFWVMCNNSFANSPREPSRVWPRCCKWKK